MSDTDMALPPGKTCWDCFHFRRYEFLVGSAPTWTKCDWSPSRFVEDRQAAAVVARVRAHLNPTEESR